MKQSEKNECELCGAEATCSAVIRGRYYRNVCATCRTANLRVSSGVARWNRQIDLEDNEHLAIQPFLPNGKPNLRFAKVYPDKARELFGDYDLRKAGL